MSLLTGHGISPPMCGTGDCRDGDKLLCNNDVAHKPTMLPTVVGVEDLNLGTPEKPNMVNISKSLNT